MIFLHTSSLPWKPGAQQRIPASAATTLTFYFVRLFCDNNDHNDDHDYDYDYDSYDDK